MINFRQNLKIIIFSFVYVHAHTVPGSTPSRLLWKFTAVLAETRHGWMWGGKKKCTIDLGWFTLLSNKPYDTQTGLILFSKAAIKQKTNQTKKPLSPKINRKLILEEVIIIKWKPHFKVVRSVYGWLCIEGLPIYFQPWIKRLKIKSEKNNVQPLLL